MQGILSKSLLKSKTETESEIWMNLSCDVTNVNVLKAIYFIKVMQLKL